jgi:protein-disulfide isomerase
MPLRELGNLRRPRGRFMKSRTTGARQVEATLAGALSPADMKKVRAIEATEMGQIDAAIQRDIALGTARQVNGTPTIFVTHAGQTTPLPAGGVNYPLLKQYLDYLLQQR